jgi:HD-GYP domain-containing protein (c-di-GMP phosphodiesterase class II)
MPAPPELSLATHDLIACLADTMDLVSRELADHHRRVGLIAQAIGHQLGLSPEEQTELLWAGSLHDIGALSLQERLQLMAFETTKTDRHAETGALLLELFTPFHRLARLVRHHHVRWENGAGARRGSEEVPLGSHILHLADRIAVLLGPLDRVRMLATVRDVRERIEAEAGGMFHPRLVDAFRVLAGQECFWLDLAWPGQRPLPPPPAPSPLLRLDADGVLQLSRLFARIIDFRSPFTATHSSGVAACAETLARLSRLPSRECSRIRIAGLLHDLGKLAVPTEILEKAGPLDGRERAIVRCHTYYTYRALSTIRELGEIAAWSAYHHEHLDGSGYPFHKAGDELPLEARIVAVADVFTAIAEDRPYRQGMNSKRIREVMTAMAGRSRLDRELVELTMASYAELDDTRRTAQL